MIIETKLIKVYILLRQEKKKNLFILLTHTQLSLLQLKSMAYVLLKNYLDRDRYIF